MITDDDIERTYGRIMRVVEIINFLTNTNVDNAENVYGLPGRFYHCPLVFYIRGRTASNIGLDKLNSTSRIIP